MSGYPFRNLPRNTNKTIIYSYINKQKNYNKK